MEGLYRPATEIAPFSDQLGMSTTGSVTDLLHSVSRAVRSDTTYFIARLPSRKKYTMTDRAYTRPIDRSLEAYKAWIQNIVIRLGGSVCVRTWAGGVVPVAAFALAWWWGGLAWAVML